MLLAALRFAPLLTSLLIAGCSLSIGDQLDALDVVPAPPSLSGPISPCLPDGGLAVSGTRPAATRVIASVTSDDGERNDIELAGFSDELAWTSTLRLEREGDYSVEVLAETRSGVRSAAGRRFNVRVDRTAPAAPTGSFPPRVAAGRTLDVAIVADADVDNVTCTNATVTGADGVFVGTFAIGDGDNTVTCTATDACGLSSTSTAVVVVGARLAAPLLDVRPGDVRLIDDEPTAVVVGAGTAAGASAVLLSVDGAAPTTVTTSETDGGFAFEAELVVGEHTLELIATGEDSADSAPTVVAVTVLEQLATPAVLCPPTVTNATSLVLSGTRAPDARIEIFAAAEPGVIEVTIAPGAATWSGAYDVAGRTGAFTFAVRAADDAGVSTAVTCSTVFDRTLPAAPTLAPILAVVDSAANTGVIAFSGTGEPGTTVGVQLDDGPAGSHGTVAADGRWSFELVVSGLGAHTIAVTLTDAAGNRSAVTTQDFTVRQGLRAPTLSSPRLPLQTRAASVVLRGTREAGTGIKVRFVDGGADVVLAAIDDATTFEAPLTLAPNATTRFCLFAFDDELTSILRCQVGASTLAPFEIVNDTTPPAPPTVTTRLALQRETSSATIGKEEGAVVSVSRNAAPATPVGTPVGTTTTATLALDVGDTVFCFTQTDVAGNESTPACVTIRRTIPRLDLFAPTDFSVINGDRIVVQAERAEAVATIYRVCVTTPQPLGRRCESFSAEADGRLDVTMTIDTAPLAATLATVEVCGNDVDASNVCATRQIVRQREPEQRSSSSSAEPKSDPQIALDLLGFVHLVWTDTTRCSTGHTDVITSIARGTDNRVTIVVTRPAELNLFLGDRFDVFGTVSFNGSYRVASLVDGVIVTEETRTTGATETAGNIVTDAIDLSCRGTNIHYARFDDAGWSETINLSDVGGDGESKTPSLVVDTAGDIHVAWSESGNLDPASTTTSPPVSPADGNGGIDIVHRVIDGVTGAISLPRVVSTQDDAGPVDFDRTPVLAADDDGVVIAWDAQLGQVSRRLLVARFDGTGWAAPTTIVTVTGSTPLLPSIVASSVGATVAWQEKTGRSVGTGVDVAEAGSATGADIDVVVCALDAADLCAPADELVVSAGNDQGVSAEPVLALTGAGVDEVVHVVWGDDESRGPSRQRIQHKELQLRRAPRVIGTQRLAASFFFGTNAIHPTVVATADDELLILWVDNDFGHGIFSTWGALMTRSANGTPVFTTIPEPLPGLNGEVNGGQITGTTNPTVAVGVDRTAWIAVSQQVNKLIPDSEIYVHATTY